MAIPGRHYGRLKYSRSTYDHWPFVWYPDIPLPVDPMPPPTEIWVPVTIAQFRLGNQEFEIPNG